MKKNLNQKLINLAEYHSLINTDILLSNSPIKRKLNSNLNSINYQSIAAELITSNVITSCDFAMEDNFYGHNKYFSNDTTFISFECL